MTDRESGSFDENWDVAAAVGRGLFAGAVGTAAMTVSSTIEARLQAPRFRELELELDAIGLATRARFRAFVPRVCRGARHPWRAGTRGVGSAA